MPVCGSLVLRRWIYSRSRLRRPAVGRADRRRLRNMGRRRRRSLFFETRQMELNAMAADQFAAVLEWRLIEQGIQKVAPDRGSLERHAREVIQQRLTQTIVHENR